MSVSLFEIEEMIETRKSGTRPYSHLSTYFVLVVCIAVFEFLALVTESYEIGNSVGPICLGLASIWALFKVLRASPLLFLSAFPWALIAIVAYFAIGPLALVFGTSETINSYHKGLEIRPEELLQTNLLNSSFIAILVLSFFCVIKGKESSLQIATFMENLNDQSAAKKLIYICLSVGVPIQFFFFYPTEFGYVNTVVPAAVLRLGGLTTLALVPIWFLFGSKRYFFAPLAILLLLVEFSMALLTFAKTAVLLCLVLAGIGLYFSNRSQRFLVCLALFLAVSFLLVDPIVKVCREEGGHRINEGFSRNLEQRFDLLLRVVTDENGIRSRRIAGEIQHGWLRLNYSNAQYFVMREYNEGRSFDFYKNALWAFVPRILVPNKPNMTELGIELNYLINRHRKSSMAVGIAAEAYGVGGPVYVLFAAVFVGCIFGFLDSRYAFNMKGGWLYLPIQVICMRMGYRLDGALVPDYLGSLVIVIAYHFIATILITQWLFPNRGYHDSE